MVLLRDVSIVLILFGLTFASYRLLTKICRACGFRVGRWRSKCLHCGRNPGPP